MGIWIVNNWCHHILEERHSDIAGLTLNDLKMRLIDGCLDDRCGFADYSRNRP